MPILDVVNVHDMRLTIEAETGGLSCQPIVDHHPDWLSHGAVQHMAASSELLFLDPQHLYGLFEESTMQPPMVYGRILR
jgi:hypothetical protein